MINKIIASLNDQTQSQLMYAFNESIAQYIVLEQSSIVTCKLPAIAGKYYVGCHLPPNPKCFKPIQQSGVWSYGLFLGCLC